MNRRTALLSLTTVLLYACGATPTPSGSLDTITAPATFEQLVSNSKTGSLSLKNSGGQAFTYTTSVNYQTGSDWLTLTPASGTIAPGATANVSYTAVCPPTPGTYTATVTVTPAGLTPRTVTVTMTCVLGPDTTNPTLSASASALTRNTTASLTGQATDDRTLASLTYTLGATTTPITVDANGSFTVDAGPLAEGDNTLTITATDAAGNTTSQTVNVKRDSVAPTLTATGNALTRTTPVQVTGQTTDLNGVTSLTYTLGTTTETVTPDANGNFTVQAGPLDEGTNTLTFTASDAAGNTTTRDVQIQLDATLPSIDVLTASADTTGNLTASGTVNGTGSAATATYTLTSGATTVVPETALTLGTGGAFTITRAGLPDGTYTLRVNATDAAGNTTFRETSITVAVGKPNVTILPVAPNSGTVTATGSVTPGTTGVAIQSVTFEVLSGATVVKSGNAVLGADGTSYTLSATGLTEGSYTLRVTAQDANSNVGTSTATFSVDTTAPVISGVSSTTTVKGNGNKLGVVVTFTVNETNLQRVEFSSDGGTNYSPATLVSGTTYRASYTTNNTATVSVKLRAVDTVGQEHVFTHQVK